MILCDCKMVWHSRSDLLYWCQVAKLRRQMRNPFDKKVWTQTLAPAHTFLTARVSSVNGKLQYSECTVNYKCIIYTCVHGTDGIPGSSESSWMFCQPVSLLYVQIWGIHDIFITKISTSREEFKASTEHVCAHKQMLCFATKTQWST